MKIACVQISNQLINPAHEPPTSEERYFETLYSSVSGYHRGKDFWEVPLWVAKVSYSILDADLIVARNIVETIKELQSYDAVMFSVLEVNKHFVLDVVSCLPNSVKVVLGGYIDPEFFDCLFEERTNVHWFSDLSRGIEFLGYEFRDGVSYKLFKDLKTIPRLSLSDGCLNHCSFCTIPKKIKEYSYANIMQQIDSMAAWLDFELVYINDKTFGQAKNHIILPGLYEAIKRQNPAFQGFIIQTTANDLLKLNSAVLSTIKYVELGIESYNDAILKVMRKPHRIETINRACWLLRSAGIKLVPNIMVSLPGETAETYGNTFEFLSSWRSIISHVNIYSLALYEETELAEKLEHTETDLNENSQDKSWSDGKLDKWFYSRVINWATKQIKGR